VAVLHLEFEIDSEVYPELHATLSSISGEASRGERLRQLAASGLVWEYVRLRTPAMPVAPVQRAGQPTPPLQAQRAAAAAAERPPASRGAATTAASARAGVAARRAESPADFVDLGIDAVPSPMPPAVEVRPPEPPLLVDVVDEHEAPARDAEVEQGHDSVPADEASSTRARLLRMRDRGLFRNG
jgi:hypothetical protein